MHAVGVVRFVAALAAALLLAAGPQPASADARGAAVDACYRVKRSADQLLGKLGPVACLPGATDDPERYDLIVIARQPLFTATPTRRAFVVVVAGAVGRLVNARHHDVLRDLWLTDARLVQQRRAYVLPAAVAAETQGAVKAGRMALEDMYFRLELEMQSRHLRD